MVHNRYPEATCTVSWGTDNADAVHLYATVDLMDTDELVDLVVDRKLALHEQGVLIHVIPLRTPEREGHVRRQLQAKRHLSE